VQVVVGSRVVKASVGLYIGQWTWLAVLPPMAATFYPINITAVASSGQKAVLADVLFGDVFICGGQSNMVYPKLLHALGTRHYSSQHQ
jgi:hypothetical protein